MLTALLSLVLAVLALSAAVPTSRKAVVVKTRQHRHCQQSLKYFCGESSCPEVNITAHGNISFKIVVYDSNDAVANSLLSTHQWETHGVQQIQYALSQRPGSTFVDIGANLGWYTLLAAAKGSAVIAVEPLQTNVVRLRQSICRNPHLQHLIEVIPAALGTEAQENCTLYSSMSNQGDGTITCDPNFEPPPDYEIRQRGIRMQRLDDLLRHVEDIGVIKMDIEGFEHYAVLGGNETFFERRVPYIMVEYSPQALGPRTAPEPPQSFLQKFEDARYTLTTASFDAPMPMSVAQIHAATDGPNLVDVFMTLPPHAHD